MDDVDRRILRVLQEASDLPVAEIAERVGLSPSPCWRRIQKLEAEGVIERRVALLNPEKMNVGVTVFVAIRTSQHDAKWLAQFAERMTRIPEVVELYRMSGEIDYMMRVVVPDIKAYDDVYKRLIAAVPLFDVSSSFAMETLKFTTALPVDYAR
ncbi:MAG TPA: Lrp/AsnC family transcriptional regulator [Kiloniellaceae bacterium]